MNSSPPPKYQHPPSYAQAVLGIENTYFPFEEFAWDIQGETPSTIPLVTPTEGEGCTEPSEHCCLPSVVVPSELLSPFMAIRGKLKIVTTSDVHPCDPFVFTIQESSTNDILLCGKVARSRDITIEVPNGRKLIAIYAILHQDERKFQVHLTDHNGFGDIGIVGRNITYLKSDGHPYSVHSLLEDVLIFRHLSPDILAKIHIQNSTSSACNASRYLEPSITFTERMIQPITDLEKALCLSVAVVYMLEQEGSRHVVDVTQDTDATEEPKVCSKTRISLSFFVFLIIIFINLKIRH